MRLQLRFHTQYGARSPSGAPTLTMHSLVVLGAIYQGYAPKKSLQAFLFLNSGFTQNSGMQVQTGTAQPTHPQS